MNKLLIKLVTFIYKNPFKVLLFWLAIFFIGLSFSLRLGEVIVNKFPSPEGTNSGIARKLIDSDFPNLSSDNLILVLDSKEYKKTEANFIEYQNLLANKLSSLKEVKSIQSSNELGILLKDKTSFLLISLNSKYISNTLVPELRTELQQVPNKYKIDTYLTGMLAHSYDSFLYGNVELKKVEKYAITCSLIVLIYVFGGFFPAFLTLLTGLFCFNLGFAFLYLVAYFSTASSMSEFTVSLLSLAIGIDYPLFIINRFREEYLKNNDTFESFKTAAITAGKAVIFSGIMILSGAFYLLINLNKVVWIAPSAICSIGVVFISLILSLTLIPAILFLVEKKFNLQKLIEDKFKLQSSDKFWLVLGKIIKSYPKSVLVLNLLIIFALMSPLKYTKVWFPNISQGIEIMESKKGFNILKENRLSGQLTPIYVLVDTNGKANVLQKDFLVELNNFVTSFQKNVHVKEIKSIVSFQKNFMIEDYLNFYANPLFYTYSPILKNFVNEKKDKTLLMFTSAFSPDSKETKFLVNEIRSYDKFKNFAIYVGGNQAESIDGHQLISSKTPYISTFNLITIFIILTIYFKSIFIPLKAIITNLMPIFASLGVVVLIFQYGYGASLIGAEKNGFIMSITPITLLTVLFGISIDYEIMILSRIKEAYEKSQDNTQAVLEGISKSGGVIVGAALIMLTVFGSYMFANISSIKEMSVALFIAVLIEVTIVRLLLVPSIMIVMGKWNYWLPFKKN